MEPKVDRLAYADCAHVEAELRAKARGEALAPPLPCSGNRSPTCPVCGRCSDAAIAAPWASPLSTGELDALHFRFWSADHKRFDHIGFAHAVLAASARSASRYAE